MSPGPIRRTDQIDCQAKTSAIRASKKFRFGRQPGRRNSPAGSDLANRLSEDAPVLPTNTDAEGNLHVQNSRSHKGKHLGPTFWGPSGAGCWRWTLPGETALCRFQRTADDLPVPNTATTPWADGCFEEVTDRTGHRQTIYVSVQKGFTSGDGAARQFRVSTRGNGGPSRAAYFVRRGRASYSPLDHDGGTDPGPFSDPKRHDSARWGDLQTPPAAGQTSGKLAPPQTFGQLWANRKAFPKRNTRGRRNFRESISNRPAKRSPTDARRDRRPWGKQRRHLRRVCRSSSRGGLTGTKYAPALRTWAGRQYGPPSNGPLGPKTPAA